jgi:FkbM family methyltransferase
MRFCNRFGLIKGGILWIKFGLGYVSNIKLSTIKYPFFLRAKTSDVSVFSQVFLRNEYDIEFDNPKIVIDGGANVGLFAIWIKNKYPDAKIVCVEPDPENFAILQKNVAPYDGIYCANCGLWDKDTKLRVYDKYNIGKWAMIVEEDLKDGNIAAMSISTLFRKYDISNCDVLKLDVETSEKQIFSANFEEWLPKVKNVVIELHDRMQAGCSKPFFEAINKCCSQYEFLTSGENVVLRHLN